MERPIRLSLLCVFFLSLSCTQLEERLHKSKNQTTKAEKEGASADALPTVEELSPDSKLPSKPTKPNGGDIPGHREQGDPREDILTTRANSRQPINWGVGAAGITFSTTRDEAHKILGAPIAGENSTRVEYPEGLLIQWDGLEDESLPLNIVAIHGYLGGFKLGDREIYIGDSFKDDFANDTYGINLIRSVSNTLEKVEGQEDCLAVARCIIVGGSLSPEHDLAFMQGSLAFSNTSERTLIGIIISRNQRVFPSTQVLEPVDLATGGSKSVNLNLNRSQIEERLGPPSRSVNDPAGFVHHFYDYNNIRVSLLSRRHRKACHYQLERRLHRYF